MYQHEKRTNMTPPKKVLASQGGFFDPRIQGKIHSPEGWPQVYTNVSCAFSMNFPVATITACTNSLTSYDTDLYTFSVDPPVNRNIDTFQNGPIVLQGAAIQLISDITTNTNSPNFFEISLRVKQLSHSIVSTPNYGSDGLDLFDGGTFDADTSYVGGADNAVISPGTDSNGVVRGTKYAAWASDTDTTITGGNYNAHYLADTSTITLRVTTQRPSGSAVVSVTLNAFIWGIMLPPLRNPLSL